jgi:hypothetical protein
VERDIRNNNTYSYFVSLDLIVNQKIRDTDYCRDISIVLLFKTIKFDCFFENSALIIGVSDTLITQLFRRIAEPKDIPSIFSALRITPAYVSPEYLAQLFCKCIEDRTYKYPQIWIVSCLLTNLFNSSCMNLQHKS